MYYILKKKKFFIDKKEKVCYNDDSKTDKKGKRKMKNVILGKPHHDLTREVTITFTTEELLRLTVSYGQFAKTDEQKILLESGYINKDELPLDNGYTLYNSLCDLLNSMGFEEPA